MLDYEKVLKCEVQLSNGNIVKEEVIFDKDNTEDAITDAIQEIRQTIKDGFRTGEKFNVTIGYTIFRGSSIEAVKFTTEDKK